MSEGFWGGLNRHLIFWSSWVFTVGGAVSALWIGGEFRWIGALLALAGLAGLTTFAYRKHQDLIRAEQGSRIEKNDLDSELKMARRRVEEAERKLNSIPADILLQLQAVIERNALETLVELAGRHGGYIRRMIQFKESAPKPIALRTFVRRADNLFVEGKLGAEAMRFLKMDDPFFLDHKDASALTTISAQLRVHQLEASKEIVWFEIVASSGDEIAKIEALAAHQEVSAKGYSARPACDTDRYAELNMTDFETIVSRIAHDLAQLRG